MIFFALHLDLCFWNKHTISHFPRWNVIWSESCPSVSCFFLFTRSCPNPHSNGFRDLPDDYFCVSLEDMGKNLPWRRSKKLPVRCPFPPALTLSLQTVWPLINWQPVPKVPGSELLQKKNCSSLAGESSASIFATAFKGKFVIRQRGQRQAREDLEKKVSK